MPLKIYLLKVWEYLKSSFWFFPGLIIISLSLLFLFTIHLDQVLGHSPVVKHYSLWQGGAQGAQQVLATIAGALIALMSIVFSVVTIPFSIAASQYGSRLIRNFMRDPGTQIVLGFFTGTSIYCIFVLSAIKIEPETVVPDLSITVSLILSILSLLMLIYFIHHVSTQIQSPEIIFKLGQDLIYAVERSFPGQIVSKEREKELEELANSITKLMPEYKIISSVSGYVQSIDYDGLMQIAKNQDFVIRILPRPSNFIKQGSPLALIYTKYPLEKKIEKSILNEFIIGKNRILLQDIEYSLDQLVTISIRAVSEDARDTFTANFCIDYIGDALSRLCRKNIPSCYYQDEKECLKLIIKQITFAGLVDSAFNQIRQFGTESPSVIIHLLDTIHSIIPFIATNDQKEVFKEHAIMIKRAGDRFLEPKDKKDLEERFSLVIKELAFSNESIYERG